MSEYMDFYIKNENDYVPFYNCSRSNYLCCYLSSFAPTYSMPTELKENFLETAKENVVRDVNRYKERKKIVKGLQKTAIKSGSYEMSYDLMNELDEIEEELESLRYTYSKILFLEEMVDNFRYDDNELKLYFGIECNFESEE